MKRGIGLVSSCCQWACNDANCTGVFVTPVLYVPFHSQRELCMKEYLINALYYGPAVALTVYTVVYASDALMLLVFGK